MDRKRQQREELNSHDSFVCSHCGHLVNALAPGTKHRNHCPQCLWSQHLDLRPGDRMSYCRGTMEPIALWVKDCGEWALIHRCTNCGVLKSNRVAGDDEVQTIKALIARSRVLPR